MQTTQDIDVARARRRLKIIGKIQEWVNLHGKPPRAVDWKHVHGTDWPSFMTVVRTFGSWDAAILAAGHKPRGRGRPKL